MKARITDIQRFCMHDGDGLRTTVFFKGCMLRCVWCHNPETQKQLSQLLYYKQKCINCGECAVCKNGVHGFEETHCVDYAKCIACGECAKRCPAGALEIAGQDIEVDEIVKRAMRDVDFYGDSGGVTLSGGEPMLQPKAAIELLKKLKENEVNTAVETCGYFDKQYLEEVVKYTDKFLWDIKDTDDTRHTEYTGVSNRKIIENLLLADSLGAKTVLRCIVVNGVNANEAHCRGIAEIYEGLTHCEGVELLPCHRFGLSKSEALGRNTSDFPDFTPSKEILEGMKSTLERFGVKLL